MASRTSRAANGRPGGRAEYLALNIVSTRLIVNAQHFDVRPHRFNHPRQLAMDGTDNHD